MKQSNKHILFRTTFLLVVALLCLPCSAKREIKLALDIPVMENEHKSNGQLVQGCSSFISQQHVVKQIDFQNSLDGVFPELNLFTTLPFRVYSNLHESSLSELEVHAIVPIYIIHERYRI